MAFETRKVYRAINGHEIKGIIAKRVEAAMLEDNSVNMARSFPLFKYIVRVELIPYHMAGPNDAKPDASICYEVDGAIFTPAISEPSVELVEESPVYGKEADPQELRTLAEQGTVETVRAQTGELVDVRTKPGTQEPVEMPRTEEPVTVPSGRIDERPEETLAAEQQRWTQVKDPEVDKAASRIVRNFEEEGDIQHPGMAAGRVSVIKSVAMGGGADHGRGKKK